MTAKRVRARSVAVPGVAAAVLVATGCAPVTDLPPDVGSSLRDPVVTVATTGEPSVVASSTSTPATPSSAPATPETPPAAATAEPSAAVAASASAEPSAAPPTPSADATTTRVRVLSKSKALPYDHPATAPQTRRGPLWSSDGSDATIVGSDPAPGAWPKRDDTARVQPRGD